MSDNSALQFTARQRSHRLPQNSNISILERSKLVSLLSDFTSTKAHSSEANLALQMSRLMGLSDSISLARDLAYLPDIASESSANPNAALVQYSVQDSVQDSVQEEVLAGRARMLGVINASFSHGEDLAPIHVPSASAGIKLEALLNYQPYQRFYITHQVEMAAGVDSLRQAVRKNLIAFSGEMHQLAELDKIVDQSLAIQARKLFNVTPKLLEHRFEQLRRSRLKPQADPSDGDDLNRWLAQDGWLALFYHDMRELLLAEFDVRLQPVLGLLEALNEQVPQNHD